ncbi:TIGR03032 family protein, partial [Alphaproteobacteria bacterium]|nr:TIGR03032 family protein [Alphaproteobacteria bacterium]MDA8730286.1 TIGR03032 family protein [Alphaproteobacteria bacterium]
NWRLGVYDGGIIEFDIDSCKFNDPILRDCWMPHSPQLIGENLMYCDSMRGSVNCGTWKKMIKFNGFVRGLAYDNQFYYVGHSMHRHIHRLENVSSNVSIDTGIFMFDEQSKISKFFHIPQLTDIHSLYIQK